MPNYKGSNSDQGSRGTGSQSRENGVSSYSPEWLRKSRDDVPQTGKPLRKNPVVEAIMANPGNERPREVRQPAPEQAPAKSKE